MDPSDVMFSRPPNPDRMEVECRPKVSVPVASVLDAHCAARSRREGRRFGRDALAAEILTEWAQHRHEEATLTLRLAGGNPIEADSTAGDD